MKTEVLLVVYRLFAATSEWPTFDQIDYEVDLGGLGDAWSILRSMPPKMVGGSDMRTPPSQNQQFHLTIRGMDAASEHHDGAATDFRVFCASVVYANRLSDETRPPETAHLSAAEVARMVDLPTIDASGVLARVGKQWEVNGHLWSQFHGGGDTWSATLNRKALRAYRGVRDNATFVEAERQRLARLSEESLAANTPGRNRVPAIRPSAGAVGHTPAPVPETSSTTSLPAWFVLLAPGLATHLRSRLEAGHPEDAFLHGWKVLAHELSLRTGISADGYELVNKAARTFDTSALPPSEANTVHGYFDLMRALARIRNVQSHSGNPQFTDIESATFILAIGTCLEWCTQLPPPGE